MQRRKFPLAVAGGVFWATTIDGEGQEEQGRHPWIIVSPDRLAEDAEIVIAVPMTSNPFQYRSGEQYVGGLVITRREGVSEPLDVSKMDGNVRCQKVRHWSADRVKEIVADVDQFGIEKLRGIVADLLDLKRRR